MYIEHCRIEIDEFMVKNSDFASQARRNLP